METITTRSIAERAGVGIGLINYHFRTKENLVELCVQQIIENVITEFRPAAGRDLDNVELLAGVAKSVADFLAENPAVAQISILGDYKSPKLLDNTMKTVRGFGASLKGYDLAEKDKTVLLFALTSVIQAMFLRRNMSGELFGYDFREKSQRDAWIDLIVRRIF